MSVEEKHIEKVFDLYQEKSKNFQRIFSILLGFALIFFFIIFLPYSSLLSKNYELGQSLNETQNSIDAYQKGYDGILKFQNATINMPQKVSTFLKSVIDKGEQNSRTLCGGKDNGIFLFQINSESQKDILTFINDNKQIKNELITCKIGNYNSLKENRTNLLYIYNKDRNVKDGTSSSVYYSLSKNQNATYPLLDHESISLLPYFHCGINMTNFYLICNSMKQITDISNQLNQSITHDIISPLKIFGNKSEILADIMPNFNQEFFNLSNTYTDTAQKTIKEVLDSNATGQNLLLSKDELNSQLIPKLEKVNADFLKNNTLIRLNKTLEEGLNTTLVRKNQLMDDKIDIKAKQTEIANRINQTESPVGKIPIGINESVALFPFGLAIGFLISASLLYDTIRLRSEYHRLTNAIYSKHKYDVTIEAPLWIDPVKLRSKKYFHRQEHLAKIVVFFVPVIIFFISLFLISGNYKFMNTEDFENVFPYNKELYQIVYNGLYFLSLILICYVIIILFIELYRYTGK